MLLDVRTNCFNNHRDVLGSHTEEEFPLLGACVLYGFAFMLWIQFWYEQFQHGIPYLRCAYSTTKTLGFCSAAYFCIGYTWLVVVVTRG